MKIKLSKSQWEDMGKKAGWMKLADNKTAARQKLTKPQNVIDVPQEMKASDLFKQFLQEGKKPRQAAEELLDILTTGTFAAIEEPKRTEMINSVIEKFSK
jgi:hypothetical protein